MKYISCLFLFYCAEYFLTDDEDSISACRMEKREGSKNDNSLKMGRLK
ncbi:hypothetical protein EDWATA_03707 [Edwardsiella tarda ATCC 23685]|uniref:Uncharacterized protein n=1 Tax=Edwardsiella tarda ATCC 23685 TaxID=500638 RepID=D4FA89_EDWTA|nr:hypothetical protein EDWATA_03707 [Edwardsiella tarda ATCC 23685]